MSQKPEDSGPDLEQPFITHLLELRNRLLHIVFVVFGLLVVLMPFANQIYALLAEPLISRMPQGSTMIAIEVASPFLAPFKLTLVLAVFLAIPFILYQVWAFVAPGLYKHERQLVLPLLASSTALFFLGMLFAYAVVFPLMFGFLATTAPTGVAMMTDINKYLDFMLTMFFAFGIAFEVPVATFILVWMGVTTPDKLTKKRPYVVLGAFVIGAVLTPPDGVTQTLLAVPMWLLFELGIVFARMFAKRRAEAAAAAESSPAGMSEEDMEAELDRIDTEERAEAAKNSLPESKPDA